MKKKICIVLIALLLGGGLFYFLKSHKKSSIIIILIDALRKDHLSCYGYGRNTSPNIDKFASEAIKFDNCVSTCSWTSPSVASLFTSLYVSSHGLMTHSNKDTDILPLELVTLAELLKENGYATAAFVANRWIREEFNYNQGFDLFKQVGTSFRPSAATVREKAIAWLHSKPNKPFFLYLHFMDVHGPYLPPYPYNTLFTSETQRELSLEEYEKLRYLKIQNQTDLNFYINQYDGGIKYCDYHIGKILNYLREEGLFKEAAIIITSDHGEAFFEHGACDHGFTLYNEEINVPLFLKLPASCDAIIMQNIKTQLIDLGVTIAHLIGATFPYKVDGINLITKNTQADNGQRRKRLYSEEYMKGFPKIAMIEKGMKYIFHSAEKRIVEVFDLNEDQGELNNMMNAHNHISYEHIEKDISEWSTMKNNWKMKTIKEQQKAVIDPDTLEHLKSLGYIHNRSQD
ncbi:MAG: sulfatase [bacterium]